MASNEMIERDICLYEGSMYIHMSAMYINKTNMMMMIWYAITGLKYTFSYIFIILFVRPFQSSMQHLTFTIFFSSSLSSCSIYPIHSLFFNIFSVVTIHVHNKYMYLHLSSNVILISIVNEILSCVYLQSNSLMI